MGWREQKKFGGGKKGKKKEVKETGLGLSFTKDESFGEWYSEVVGTSSSSETLDTQAFIDALMGKFDLLKTSIDALRQSVTSLEHRHEKLHQDLRAIWGVVSRFDPQLTLFPTPPLPPPSSSFDDPSTEGA